MRYPKVYLYVPNLTYSFGEATIDGKFAVISLHRLRPEFYGAPNNDELYADRSTTDKKSSKFCDRCAESLDIKLRPLKKSA